MRVKNIDSKKLILSLSLMSLISFAAGIHAQPLTDSSTRTWLKSNVNFNVNKLLESVSPSDASPGAVIAAKSRANPNYYYHWVRDAGLTVDSMIDILQTKLPINNTALIRKRIAEYIDFSSAIQHLHTQADLGEPKFNVNGTTFEEMWARPQNDSPALRAISLIHWAKLLIAEGKIATVKEKLYDTSLPAKLPIKMDLEYVSHHWSEPSYDLWEEVKGKHFYSLMVERRALLEGAKLANQLGDTGASAWYSEQGKNIEKELVKFWDANKGYYVATKDRVGGIDYKSTNLDTAVILGLSHGDMHDGFLPWSDAKVQATIQKTISVFSNLYTINHRSDIPGVAIGRYPEDKYNGTGFSGGNPWPLCTLAVAEALYRYSADLKSAGNKVKAEEVAKQADQFVERVRYHAHANGSLDEQIDRNTGYMLSAQDLTWNYAGFLTATKSSL